MSEPAPETPPGEPPRSLQSRRWAGQLSFVIGLFWFIPLTGLLAIPLARQARGLSGRRFIGLDASRWGLLLGILNLALTPVFLYAAYAWYAEMDSYHNCAGSLRQIGQAIYLYAKDHQGRCPDRFEDLLLTTEINSYSFYCLSSRDTPAPGATSREQAANLSTGGHLSYVYVGKGLTIDTPGAPSSTLDQIILAHDAPRNHYGLGMNVLYGDGHVVWVDKQQAKKLFDELNAGHNPPRAEKLK